MIALLQTKSAGLWSRGHLRNNVLAGIVVGIVGLQIATLMAGVILTVFGFARLGAVIKLWSLIEAWPTINRPTVGLALLALAILTVGARYLRRDAVVLLVEVRPNVRYKLERGGIIAQVGAENVIDTFELSLGRARELQAAFAA
jgi:MFS superfamily sulfate permease-like transporter